MTEAPPRPRKLTPYDIIKARAMLHSRAVVAAGSDIGPPPKPKDPFRRDACRLDLRSFFTTYFPAAFFWPFSAGHVEVIEIAQHTILRGGREAIAMPRKSGKTTMCIRAIIWALLYGHREFALFMGATGPLAGNAQTTIKRELGTNALLFEDFPELLHPIRALKGQARLCGGQTIGGRHTNIGWGRETLVLPTMPGVPGSGAIGDVVGIDGAINGRHHLLEDGREIRPDIIFLDDVQTADVARSRDQTQKVLDTIEHEVAYLGPIEKPVSMFAACTVRERGDVSATMLDRELKPAWNGIKLRCMVTMPTHLDWWQDTYKPAWSRGHAAKSQAEATSLYAANRAVADEGAEAAWPERYYHEHGELSAVQHAMNAWCADEGAFFAEYQNEPLDRNAETDKVLVETYLATRCLEDYPRAIIPPWADCLICTIDMGLWPIHWEVTAWNLARDCSVVIDCARWQTGLGTEDGRAGKNAPRQLDSIPAAQQKSEIDRYLTACLKKLHSYVTAPDRYKFAEDSRHLSPLFGVDVGGTAIIGFGSVMQETWAWSETVMRFCAAAGPRWLPLKGARWDEAHAIRAMRGNIAFSQKSYLWETNSDYYKSRLYAAYQIPAVDEAGEISPGARVFAAGLHEWEPRYLTMQHAEIVDDKGHWAPPDAHAMGESEMLKKKVANHWWDTAYMGFAVADIARAKLSRPIHRRAQMPAAPRDNFAEAG